LLRTGAGPGIVTGTGSLAAYFDVGITSGATSISIIINGNRRNAGPNRYVDPATNGDE
jgi:hypothetical protein